MRIYYHYARGDYCGRGEKNNNDYVSRHHAISYPHMYMFGVVLLAYFQIEWNSFEGNESNRSKRLERIDLFQKFQKYYGESSATNSSSIQSILKDHMNEGDDLFNYTDRNCQNFFMQVAWTDANLFMGPAGKFRSDDPGQGLDGIPLTLGSDEFIKKLGELRDAHFITGLPAMNQNQPSNSWINLEKEDIAYIAKEYLQHLPKSIIRQRPYETRVSDWCAVVESADNRPNNKCYDIFFGRGIKQPREEIVRFKLVLAENPQYIPAAKFKYHLCRDKVVVLIGIDHTRKDDFFIGVIRNKENSHREQANDFILEKLNRYKS